MKNSDPSSPDAREMHAVLTAVRQAADVICDRWSLLILLYTFAGMRRSGELSATTGIGSRQLKSRLEKLESQEIIVRMPYSRRPLRYENHLTLMGQALLDVFACMITWEEEHSSLTRRVKVGISHADCTEQYSSPKLICEYCNAVVSARDVVVRAGRSVKPDQLPQKESNFRRHKDATSRVADVSPLAEAIEILGDKWTIEILVLALSRIGSFVEIQQLTGIATNILTDRLSRLVANDLLQHSTVDPSRRGEYKITEKGIGFYPVLIAIQDWADDWLPERLRSPMTLIHRPCDTPLSLKLRCDSCSNDILFNDARMHIEHMDVADSTKNETNRKLSQN